MSDLEDRDRRYVWHPFTQMSDWMDSRPVVIERGEGNYLIDTDGNRYLDGISSMWVNLHGHDHPKLRRAIHEQLDRLAHSTLLGLASVPSIEVAERLVGLAPPGLTRCCGCAASSGTSTPCCAQRHSSTTPLLCPPSGTVVLLH